MEEQKETSQLLEVAYRYLGFRARSEKEMKDYLEKKAKQKKFSQTVIETAMNLLKSEGYINDRLFVEQFVSSRSNLKPKGTYVLTQELLQKGINQSLLDEYFQTKQLDEDHLASKALIKKWKSLQRLDKTIRFKKAHDFLRRRGFSYSIVKKTIEEFESKE